MRVTTAILAFLLAATTAHAHADHVPHVHGSDAVFWGLALVLFCALVAIVARR